MTSGATDRAAGGSPRLRLRWALAAGCVLVCGIAAVLWLRDGTPLLLPEHLAAAKTLWRQGGPRDYELALTKRMDLHAPEQIVTEVREGKAAKLLVNGTAVDLRDSYTVEGLFSLMEREIEMASAESSRAGQPHRAVLKAVFDGSLGLPLVFKRLASSNQSVILESESLTSKNRALYKKPQ